MTINWRVLVAVLVIVGLFAISHQQFTFLHLILIGLAVVVVGAISSRQRRGNTS